MCLNLWPIWGHRWVHLKCILEALLEVTLPVAPVQDHLLQRPLWATGHTWKSFQKSFWNSSDWTSRSGTLERFWFYLLILCGRASQAVLVVKDPLANAGTSEMWVRSLSQEDPLEEGMATHSSILAWTIPWTEGPDGLQFIVSQRMGHDNQLSTHALWEQELNKLFYWWFIFSENNL